MCLHGVQALWLFLNYVMSLVTWSTQSYRMNQNETFMSTQTIHNFETKVKLAKAADVELLL